MSLKKPPSLSSWSSNLFLGMQVPPSGQMTNGNPRLGHMAHPNTPIGHGLKTISWLRWERESKVSESFYSTNKVNVRPHSVRVGESLPATALCFQSPRCFDKKINHIIWAPPIERVWWQFILGFQVFGENGWVKNYFFTSHILLYSYRSKWIHVPKIFP